MGFTKTVHGTRRTVHGKQKTQRSRYAAYGARKVKGKILDARLRGHDGNVHGTR